jgi:hypothetical protein
MTLFDQGAFTLDDPLIAPGLHGRLARLPPAQIYTDDVESLSHDLRHSTTGLFMLLRLRNLTASPCECLGCLPDACSVESILIR